MSVTTVANAGVYTVTVTNAKNCSATVTTNVEIANCLKLGDLVWNDVNNNGQKDADELGIKEVKVELFKAKAGIIDGAVIATLSTNLDGTYKFEGLEPGDYIVQITAPTGYKSSTGTNGAISGPNEPAIDPDDNVNNDDNGTTITGQTIQSQAITLTNGGEPTTDGDDNNGN